MSVFDRVRLGGHGRLAFLVLAALLPTEVAVGLPGVPVAGNGRCDPWMDPSQPPAVRAERLLDAMTMEQKAALTSGSAIYAYFGTADVIPGIPELCIPDLVYTNGGQGVGDLQVNTTAYPAPIAQAATFDPELMAQFGRSLGTQARAKGVNILLAPNVELARVPMNGRNYEGFGEDPFLTGVLAARQVQGIQASHVVATVKHYAVNNQETDRDASSSDVDERTLREMYLPAFEMAVENGGAGSVMCSYNRINGVYSCENPTLTTLKSELGFDGFVMSDWGATHSTVESALAGLDEEHSLGPAVYYGPALLLAVKTGKVPLSRLDDMIYRKLLSLFRVGVFDHPVAREPDAFLTDADSPQANEIARRISEAGTVLLKNDGVLPLEGEGRRIALIGNVAGPRGAWEVYNGGGSAAVAGSGLDVVSPLEGIGQRAAAQGDAVEYVDGYSTEKAVELAKASDVAIVFGYYTEAEGTDLADLALRSGYQGVFDGGPPDQDALIEAVAKANPRTIVVLNTGGPALMPWVDDVAAVFAAWYPGQQGGRAIASLLYGDVNPSGRLPQTFPATMADLPIKSPSQWPGTQGPDQSFPHVAYSEGLEVGYRWYDAQGIEPLFPFGYGLSYTTFSYSDLTIQEGDARVTLRFTVRNTGDHAGAEVAQAYVRQPAFTGEPPKQLRGFRKVFLEPGERRRVTITLTQRAFEHWDPTGHAWVLPGGCYGVEVGASSRDVRLAGTVARNGADCPP